MTVHALRQVLRFLEKELGRLALIDWMKTKYDSILGDESAVSSRLDSRIASPRSIMQWCMAGVHAEEAGHHTNAQNYYITAYNLAVDVILSETGSHEERLEIAKIANGLESRIPPQHHRAAT